jgi:c-di-GMP-binding flagellar brake protein YcgR
MKADQRQHSRYRIRDAEFNVFSYGTQITGKLVNISHGGLAFQFAPGPGKKTECRAIDILGPEPDRFYVSEIACRSIYDIGDLAEGRTFTGAETRLCGLQFIDLSDEQTQKLTALIDRYGVKLKTIP